MSDLNRITRRQLVGAALAATGAAVAAPGVASGAAAARASKPVDADVVVVGAGLSGLSAATQLHEQGHSVVVLEARDRVGGRNLDVPIGDGKIVELGGEWTGPGQNRVQALAKRLGIKTFETYAAGESLYVHRGRTQRYSGDIPPANAAALAELEAIILELNQMAKGVPAGKPWTAKRATMYDSYSIDRWAHEHAHTAEARALVQVAIRGVYGDDANQVGLLDLLAAITGVGGDFNTLIGSAQSIRFVGGPQQMSKRLAAALGDRVRLRHPVTAVRHDRHGVVVTTAKTTFHARAAILAIPKPLLARLHFSPELPADWVQYLQRQPTGATIKVNAVYRTPFWRKQGLSGSVVSDAGPMQVVYDNSPPDGNPGVLVGFMEGGDGRHQVRLPAAERRRNALECFARYFGSAAAHPIGYHEKAWAKDQWAQGAYGTFSPPGVLTGVAALLSETVGRLHFAGADFSPSWPGYMDGAIGSGEAAAKGVATMHLE
ncbi:MAG TPA: FAD-dependent oxidoreductase [Mycobacteriales bacterium]|nr:FAD-dependent oxidoreductase [Mycobacteriales bacterium]